MNRADSSATTRRTRSDGRRSHQAILDAAARLATVEGLNGLSIGNLADHIGMSKSGLYAHFGSKEELQLATVDTAAQIFNDQVVEPAADAAPGRVRLWRLSESFLSHLERRVFPGGCFFASAGAELDTQPGVVRQAVAEFQLDWLHALEDAARDAIAAGELPLEIDAEQLAFEVDAMLLAANAAFVLTDDRGAIERARVGVTRLLGPPPRPARRGRKR